MSLGSRLDRVAPGLTAHERAVLIVRAHHAGERSDPLTLLNMPRGQSEEYNRHLALANGAVHVLLPRALMLRADVEALELRALLAATLALWENERLLLATDLHAVVRIPIAASKYEALLAAERRTFLTLAEAADLVALERDDADERAVLRELRALVAKKAVRSRGRGRALEVELGSLYDRLGLTLEVLPEQGGRYEVVPDEDYDTASWRRESAERALSRLAALPLESKGGHTEEQPLAALRARVERDVRCGRVDLQALEQLAGEVRDDFGDDVVIPDVLRSLLDEVGTALDGLAAQGWPSPAEGCEAELEAAVGVLRAAVDEQAEER